MQSFFKSDKNANNPQVRPLPISNLVHTLALGEDGNPPESVNNPQQPESNPNFLHNPITTMALGEDGNPPQQVNN